MDERQTRSRSNKRQRNLIVIAVAAVVLLVIGGIIGSAIQGGKTKSVTRQLNEANAQLAQLGDKYTEQINTMQQLLEDKQAEIDRLSTGQPAAGAQAHQTGADQDAAPDRSDEGGSGIGWLGTFIIIFIIVILIICAILVAYNAFRKRDDDDYDEDDDYDDDDDYDEDEDDYLDYDDEDEDE